MNTKNINKNTILKTSRKLIEEKGIDKLSIRAIAQESKISIGSIYKYFSTKNEILLELMIEYWEEVIMLLDKKKGLSFDEFVEEIHLILNNKSSIYGNISNHNKILKSSDLTKAHHSMNHYKIKIKDYIKESICKDYPNANINNNLFDYAEIIFNTIIQDITSNQNNYKVVTNLMKFYFKEEKNNG